MKIITETQIDDTEFLVNDNFLSTNDCIRIFSRLVELLEERKAKPAYRRATATYLALLAQYIAKKDQEHIKTKFTCRNLYILLQNCKDRPSFLPDDLFTVADSGMLEALGVWLVFISEQRNDVCSEYLNSMSELTAAFAPAAA